LRKALAIAVSVGVAAVAWWGLSDGAATGEMKAASTVAPPTGHAAATAWSRARVRWPARPLDDEVPVDAGSTAAALASPPDAASALSGFQISDYLERNAADAEAAVDDFCAENARLTSEWPLPERRGARDAASFLEPRIGWDPPGPQGTLQLDEDLSRRVGSYGDEWATGITDSDLQDVDFGWMAQAQHYDVWRPTGSADLPDTDALDQPYMSYLTLYPWVKLRLVLGLKRGDFAQASAEVRHLAWLLHTQGTVLGDMVGAVLLHSDSRARAQAASAGIDVGSAMALDAEDLARFERVTRSAAYFFYPGVSAKVVDRARRCLKNPCSALDEGLVGNSALAGFASSDNRASVEAAARSAGCDGALIDRLLKDRPATPEQGVAYLTSGVVQLYAR
jgi:hypothetical protein